MTTLRAQRHSHPSLSRVSRAPGTVLLSAVPEVGFEPISTPAGNPSPIFAIVASSVSLVVGFLVVVCTHLFLRLDPAALLVAPGLAHLLLQLNFG